MRRINCFKVGAFCLLLCFLLSACGAKQSENRPEDMPTISVSPEVTPESDESAQEEESGESIEPTAVPSVWDTRYEKWQSGTYETEAALGEEIYQAGAVRNKKIDDITVNYSFYLSEEDFQKVTALLKQESILVTNDIYKTAFTDWFSVMVTDGMCIKEYTFPLDFDVEEENGHYFVYHEIFLEGTYANQKISFCGYVSDDIYEAVYETIESYLTELP